MATYIASQLSSQKRGQITLYGHCGDHSGEQLRPLPEHVSTNNNDINNSNFQLLSTQCVPGAVLTVRP